MIFNSLRCEYSRFLIIFNILGCEVKLYIFLGIFGTSETVKRNATTA